MKEILLPKNRWRQLQLTEIANDNEQGRQAAAAATAGTDKASMNPGWPIGKLIAIRNSTQHKRLGSMIFGFQWWTGPRYFDSAQILFSISAHPMTSSRLLQLEPRLLGQRYRRSVSHPAHTSTITNTESQPAGILEIMPPHTFTVTATLALMTSIHFFRGMMPAE